VTIKDKRVTQDAIVTVKKASQPEQHLGERGQQRQHQNSPKPAGCQPIGLILPVFYSGIHQLKAKLVPYRRGAGDFWSPLPALNREGLILFLGPVSLINVGSLCDCSRLFGAFVWLSYGLACL
jgi:hypothetical protein